MDRLSQYRRKIEYVVSKLTSLPSDLDDVYHFEALLYRLHTSIDALMDVVAMLVKDLGLEVGDDYSNIEKLEEAGVLSGDMAGFLRKASGLRNVIVHRYNKLDEGSYHKGAW